MLYFKPTLPRAPNFPGSYSNLHIVVFLFPQVSSWSNFYGFDFSPVGSIVSTSRLATPSVLHVEEHQLLADPQILTSFDLKTVDREDVASIFQTLDFVVEESSDSNAAAAAAGASSAATSSSAASSSSAAASSVTAAIPSQKRSFHGFACWFDCVFATGLPSPAKPVTLSTQPGRPATHWKQTVLWLPGDPQKEESARVGVDDLIGCHVTLTQSKDNPRHYDICVDLKGEEEEDEECDFEGKDHPVPCNCGATRCLLVKTLLEKYAAEETERNEEEEENRQQLADGD